MTLAIVKTMIESAPPADSLWPEPLPLLDRAKPEPYPLDALPEVLRDAVTEVQGFTKAPVALVASSALAALSVAGQGLVDVKRAEKLVGPVGLFLLSIADSGERKSTCDGFFSAPLRAYERAEAESVKPELAKRKAEMDAWEAMRSGITEAIKRAAKDGDAVATDEHRLRLEELEANKPQPLRVPKLVRGDDTSENLAWSLAREWPSAGVLSSEAGLILGAHAMGKDTVMRNLGLLNILWDGGELSIGRRTSESFTLRGARLTVGLQVQEATLRGFFDRTGGLARGIGFLARFLVAWPESTQGFRPFADPPESWPSLAHYHRRLEALLQTPVELTEDGGLAPVTLSMEPEAKTLWVRFHDLVERELCSGGDLHDVRDVASKIADNAARLAALFHVAEHGATGVIGAEAFDGASRIAAWHLNEARRFFGELALPDDMRDAARLETWLVTFCRNQRLAAVPRREAQQYSPVRDKGRLAAAIAELEEAGRLREVTDGKRKTLHLNPALLERGAA